MRMLLQTEHAENVIIFVNRFPEIASLLFIPPITIWVSELSRLPRRVDIAAILETYDLASSSQEVDLSGADHIGIIYLGITCECSESLEMDQLAKSCQR